MKSTLSFLSERLTGEEKGGLYLDATRINQDAESVRTTRSAVSRLESAGKHAPSLTTLRKYAHAVGCDIAEWSKGSRDSGSSC